MEEEEEEEDDDEKVKPTTDCKTDCNSVGRRRRKMKEDQQVSSH